MGGIKHLVYFGSDDEFYGKLDSIASDHINSKYKLIKMEYSPGAFIDACCDHYANIIFVDFSTLKDRENILKEIVFLKKIPAFRSTLFAALLADKSKPLETNLLFSSGFSLGYVKGSEVRNFILDCFFIGLSENVSRPVFAKATDINCNLRTSICSSLTSVSIKSFCLDTDLEVDSHTLELKLNLFKDLEKEEFEVASHFSHSVAYPMTEHYELKYPYAGAWDEVTTLSIQEETVETWIDMNREDLIMMRGHFSIFTKNRKIYSPLYKVMADMPFHLDFADVVNQDILTEELKSKRPALIFLDLEVEGDLNIDAVADLINCLNEIESYGPILIILNNSSKADALKKVYGYKNIVCAPTALNIDVFKLFAKSFLERNQSPELVDCSFKDSDTLRGVEVYHDVKVMTLSEHSLSFISDCELPIFSVLRLPLPIECFVTLVPAFEKLEEVGKGTHYMGIIHILSESDRQVLRKFVNQIIYKPLTEFSDEAVQSIINQKTLVKVDKEEEEKCETKKEDVINYAAFKRPTIRGKSKL